MAVLIEAALESTIEIGAADPSSYDRLEACDFSVEGGRTPLELSLREMTSVAKHPVQVLIRPRGGAFTYGDAELTVMERQIELARALGATGVVIGALLPNRRVDRVATARLTGAIARRTRSVPRGARCRVRVHVRLVLARRPL